MWCPLEYKDFQPLERKLEFKKTLRDVFSCLRLKLLQNEKRDNLCVSFKKVKIKISFEGTEYRLTIISQFQELQFLLLLGEKKNPKRSPLWLEEPSSLTVLILQINPWNKVLLNKSFTSILYYPCSRELKAIHTPHTCITHVVGTHTRTNDHSCDCVFNIWNTIH